MTTLAQAIATYRYLDRPVIDLGTVNTSDSDIAFVLRVNTLLADGAAALNARQYADAISNYRAAESLLYSVLDPQWQPEVGAKLRIALPRDPGLFTPMLSATSQWLNVLPVAPPASPVQPTVAVNAALLDGATALRGAGLSSVSATPAATQAALADMRLATIYTNQGNTAASAAAVSRAKGLDPTVATALDPTATATASTAATAATAATAVPVQASTPVPVPVPVPKPVPTPVPTPAPVPVPAPLPAPVPTPVPVRVPALPVTVISPLPPIETLPVLPITVLAQKQAGLITGTTGSYAISPVQWAVGASAATGFAGGKGSAEQVLMSAAMGAAWGAALGAVLSAGTYGLLGTVPQGKTAYLQIGNIVNKYDPDPAVQDSLGDVINTFDNDAGFGNDVGVLATKFDASNALGMLPDFIGVQNSSQSLGLFLSGGSLVNIPLNWVPQVVVSNGGFAAVVTVSFAADQAGFSYADQVSLLMKAVPYFVDYAFTLFQEGYPNDWDWLGNQINQAFSSANPNEYP